MTPLLTDRSLPATPSAPAAGSTVFVGVLLKHWPWYLASTVGALLTALALTQMFHRQNHVQHITQAYTPGNYWGVDFKPQEISTIAQKFPTQAVLAPVAEASGAPLSELMRHVHTFIAPGSPTIDVSLIWPDQAVGEKLLGQIVTQAQAEVKAQRDSELDKSLNALAASEAAIAKEIEIADRQLDKFRTECGLYSSIATELDSLRQERSMLKSTLFEKQLDLQALQAEEKLLRPQAVTSDAPATARLTQLERSIEEKKEQALLQVQLEQNQRAFERASALHSQRLISTADFEQAKLELDLVLRQLQGSEELSTLESQRKQLEDSDPTGSRELQKLTLQIKSSTDACQEVQRLISEHDERIAALRSSAERERKLLAGREALLQRQSKLLGDIDTLERLKQSTSYLLTSTSPIEPATPATLSNFKKLAVALFGLCGLVFIAPLLLRDGLTARRLVQSSDAYRAAELGVPLLQSPAASSNPRLAALSPGADRSGLAHALLRSMGLGHYNLAIINLGPRHEGALKLGRDLANYFGRVRSPALVIDISGESAPVEAAELIAIGSSNGGDSFRVPAGRRLATNGKGQGAADPDADFGEAHATCVGKAFEAADEHRLRHPIALLSTDYGRVSRFEAEELAIHSDGVLFVGAALGALDESKADLVRTVASYGANVLGVVN
jgi:hypothetical protein